MNYVSGEIVMIGDLVKIEGGITPGNVQEVIETQQHMKEWGVDMSGLMIRSEPFGLVFWPQSSGDPVIFVSRAQVANQ